jgi:hypothetical protein
VQQEISRGTILSVSYLGALGRELPNFVDVNLNPATMVPTTITIAPDSSGKSPLAPGTKFVVPQYTSYVNTNFTSITEVRSNINSNYNALAFELQNRTLKSLQFDVNYVFSHALDYNQNAQATNTPNNQYDPNGNLRVNYGNSNYNVPNRIAGYVLYNFPNLEKKNWLGYLANDWSLNSAFQVQNGLPYSASVSGSASSLALFSSWNGAGGTSFIPQIGRNTYKYPRDLVQDVRLQKQIALTERYHLEGRVDLYNVYNHQNVTGVNTTAYALQSTGNATFQNGLAGTGTARFGAANNSNSSGFLYTPRQLQVSVKFLF